MEIGPQRMLFESTTSQIMVLSQRLAELLETASIGQVIGYDEMNQHLGIEVREHRYILSRAFETLMTKGIRFDSVYRVGYKRMDINDVAGATDRTIRKLRRTARKARERVELQLKHTNDVDDRTRNDLTSRMSLLGTIEHIAAASSVKKIERIADSRVIPFSKVLEALR